MKFNSFISSLMQGKWNLGNWSPYRLGTLCINIQRYIYIYTKTHTGISTSINKLRIFGIYKILNDSFITAKMKNVKGKKRKEKTNKQKKTPQTWRTHQQTGQQNKPKEQTKKNTHAKKLIKLLTVTPELVILDCSQMCYRHQTLSFTTVKSWMTGVICEVVPPHRQEKTMLGQATLQCFSKTKDSRVLMPENWVRKFNYHSGLGLYVGPTIPKTIAWNDKTKQIVGKI